MSDIHRHRLRRTWPEQQRPDARDGQLERRELPASNPAELAAYHGAGDPTDTADEADAAFVDLGYSDDLDDGLSQPVNGDEFGSANGDAHGDDDQVTLDAA